MTQDQPRTFARRVVVLLGLAVPTVITWVYFVRLMNAPQPWPQVAFAGGKIFQFALPITWLLLGGRGQWPKAPATRRHFAEGLLAGAGIVTVGLAAVFLWLAPSGALSPLIETSRERQDAFGIDSLAAFTAFGVFYALVHSGLEEWYWRGFVMAGLEDSLARPYAILIASLAFGAHHLLLLATFFDGVTPLALLLAGSVSLGGAMWCGMRARHGHLYGAWLSHGIVDAAIFVSGWLLVNRM